MAIERKILNIHVPVPLFERLKEVNKKHGMSYTEFMTRAIRAALTEYDRGGNLPL